MTHCWREIPRCGTDINGELIKPFQLLMLDAWSLRSSAETIEEGQTFFIRLPQVTVKRRRRPLSFHCLSDESIRRT